MCNGDSYDQLPTSCLACPRMQVLAAVEEWLRGELGPLAFMLTVNECTTSAGVCASRGVGVAAFPR